MERIRLVTDKAILWSLSRFRADGADDCRAEGEQEAKFLCTAQTQRDVVSVKSVFSFLTALEYGTH